MAIDDPHSEEPAGQPESPATVSPAGPEASSEQTVSVVAALLSSAIVWRALAVAAGLLVLLLSPARDGTRFLDEILGIVMIGVALAEQVPRYLQAPAPPLWHSLLLALAGTAIFIWPSETETTGGLLGAAAIFVIGALKIVREMRGGAAAERRWDQITRGLLLAVAGVMVAVFPEAMARLALVVIGTAMILQAVVVAVTIGRMGPSTRSELALETTEQSLIRWLARRRMPRAERDQIDAVLFFEGKDARRRTFRFAALMALATSIATFGIASDSTAVVIGAMLIAPLMTPILATGAALLTASPRRVIRAATLVTLGAAGAVALAWLLALLIPNLGAVVQNAQVTSRTAPNLIDLGIAIAAGAAGAFAVSRADVSDALPGVAVAIALVPPLAVVGITLRAADLTQALGALLLFATNLVSIIITASVIFVINGYASIGQVRRKTRHLSTAYSVVAVGLLLLVIPLGLTGETILEDAQAERIAERVIDAWLGSDTRFTIENLDVQGDSVYVTLQGPGITPPARELHDMLVEELGRPVVAELRVVPETVTIVGES
jgi:uncharacterized hydrophobic protein (TIGR00271 family)